MCSLDVCPTNILSVLQPEPGPPTAGQSDQVTPGQDLHHHPGRLQGELLLDGHQLGRGVLRYVLLLGPGLESLSIVYFLARNTYFALELKARSQKNGKISLKIFLKSPTKAKNYHKTTKMSPKPFMKFLPNNQ